MLSRMSELFFLNTKFITENSKYVSEFNKFNMYFLEDIKNNKNTYAVSSNQIIFEDGTVYTYKQNPDNGIYRNKVKICNNIVYCNFQNKEQIVNNLTKKIINVRIIINGSKLFETENDYTLKYW